MVLPTAHHWSHILSTTSLNLGINKNLGGRMVGIPRKECPPDRFDKREEEKEVFWWSFSLEEKKSSSSPLWLEGEDGENIEDDRTLWLLLSLFRLIEDGLHPNIVSWVKYEWSNFSVWSLMFKISYTPRNRHYLPYKIMFKL